MSEFGQVLTDTTLTRQVILNIESMRKGVTAPNDNLRGTSPSVPVLTFGNVNELASLIWVLPFDWNKDDFDVEFLWALNAGQTNGDTFDITLTYVVVTEAGGITRNILKTNTVETGQFTVTTAGGLTSGTVYKMTISANDLDANNPLPDGAAICFEINMTNTTGVASADLCTICMVYEALY